VTWSRSCSSANADALFGGGGDETLDGHAGDDLLTGGAGVDRFRGGLGNDVATDFSGLQGETQDGTIP
jgi:Ca2+-binding RTX toxin-like protein